MAGRWKFRFTRSERCRAGRLEIKFFSLFFPPTLLTLSLSHSLFSRTCAMACRFGSTIYDKLFGSAANGARSMQFERIGVHCVRVWGGGDESCLLYFRRAHKSLSVEPSDRCKNKYSNNYSNRILCTEKFDSGLARNPSVGRFSYDRVVQS